MLIQGRYVQPSDYFPGLAPGPSSLQPVFAAFCQPLLNPENAESLSNGNTTVFTSHHFMDMRFKEADAMCAFCTIECLLSRCAYYLGYSRNDLTETSWYSLLHPSHLEEVSYKHRLCEFSLCEDVLSVSREGGFGAVPSSTAGRQRRVVVDAHGAGCQRELPPRGAGRQTCPARDNSHLSNPQVRPQSP